MTKPILSQRTNLEKSNEDNYRSSYEALCVKLHQMKSIANITVKAINPSSKELFDTLCSFADTLAEVCDLCDNLRPQDVPSDKEK